MKHTTLRELRRHGACKDRYDHLVAALGEDWGDKTPIPLIKILETNGIHDAIWALGATEGLDRAIRHFACDCAEYALPIFEAQHPDDKRPRNAIETARRYADGLTGDEELDAARNAAEDAARNAARAAARNAAWAAAWAAALDAAWEHFAERYRFWFGEQTKEEEIG